MQERARLAGGTMSIQSAPGEATSISADLPFRPATQPDSTQPDSTPPDPTPPDPAGPAR